MTEKYFVVGDRFGNEMTLVAHGAAVVDLASRIYDAADDESGIISPAQMVDLFPGQAMLHVEMPLIVALLAAGCQHVGESEVNA